MAGKQKRKGKDGVLEVRLLPSGIVVTDDGHYTPDSKRLRSGRVSLRLGLGHVEPVDQRQAVSGLRNLFLERVRELEIEEIGKETDRPLRVLRALAAGPYQEMVKARLSDDDLFLLLEKASLEASGHLPRKLTNLHQSMLEWARLTNLKADWCIEHAYCTLWLWRESPTARESLTWENGTRLVMNVISDIKAPETISHIHQVFPAWFPDSQPLESYKKSISSLAMKLVEESASLGAHPLLALASPKTLKSLANEVVAAITATAKKQSLEAYLGTLDHSGRPMWTPVKTKRALLKRIDWTIDCTIRGLGVDEVATQAEADVGDVSKGVSEVSDLIGLPKRDDFKRGRRKGSKDSVTSDRLK